MILSGTRGLGPSREVPLRVVVFRRLLDDLGAETEPRGREGLRPPAATPRLAGDGDHPLRPCEEVALLSCQCDVSALARDDAACPRKEAASSRRWLLGSDAGSCAGMKGLLAGLDQAVARRGQPFDRPGIAQDRVVYEP